MVEIKVYNPERGTEQFRDALATAQKHNLLERVIRTSYDPIVRKLIAKQQ